MTSYSHKVSIDKELPPDGILKNMPKKEAPMSDATLRTLDASIEALHSDDPIMSKKTDLFGEVLVYPPAADPKQWPLLSFLFVFTHGIEQGPAERHYIKAKYVHRAFERPHFINDYMRFGHHDIDEVEKPKEVRKEIEIPDRSIEHKDFRFDD
jgi:hypothetical protein